MSNLAPIDYSRVKDVASRVVLADVRLQAATFTTFARPGFLPEGYGLTYSSSLKDFDWQATGQKTFETIVRYVLTGVAKPEGAEDGPTDDAARTSRLVLFEIDLTWVAAYGLQVGEIGPPDAMLDFAFANGQLNVFPYHRKQVVDLTSSSGWPALVLPVFRSPNGRPARAEGQGRLKAKARTRESTASGSSRTKKVRSQAKVK